MASIFRHDHLLLRIADNISQVKLQDAGLLSGRAGHALFFAYLSRMTGNTEFLDLAIERLNECADYFSGDDLQPGFFTFGGGALGLAWVVKHLVNQQLLPDDALALTEGVDELVESFLRIDFHNHFYDPLYGYVGAGVYLLESLPSADAIRHLKGIVDVLEAEAVYKGNFCMWEDVKRQSVYSELNNSSITCDCGLAHGVAGILAFLCGLYAHPGFADQTAYRARVGNMIEKTATWLLSFQAQTDEGLFTLPDFVTYTSQQTHTELAKRLAWCYGDLTMSYALLRAASVLNRPEWREKILQVAERSAEVPLLQSGVVKEQNYIDPTFCHGTSGIAILFSRLNAAFNSPVLAAAADRWWEVTLREVTRMVHDGSLKCEHLDDPQGSGLLYGYSGVGLSLISMQNDHLRTWEHAVLF